MQGGDVASAPAQLSWEARQDAARLQEKFTRPPWYQENSSQPDLAREGHWERLDGIQDVPLDQIDLSDSNIVDAGDFNKTSYAEMNEGVSKLDHVVRPAVQNGKGAEYFSQLDSEQGLDYMQGHRRVYDTFYVGQPIDLLKSGDTYQVGTGGYHRLKVAKDQGLTSVPAHVTIWKPGR